MRYWLGFSRIDWAIRQLWVVVALMSLTGCAAVSSLDIDNLYSENARIEGVFYSLPKGVLPLELVVYPKQAVFEVRAYKIEYHPDKDHKYFLQYRPRSEADDHITITVTKKSFLNTITADVTDQTGNVILNLLRGNKLGSDDDKTKLHAAVPNVTPSVIDRLEIDPLDGRQLRAVEARFENRIIAFVSHMIGKCHGYDQEKRALTVKLNDAVGEIEELVAKIKDATAEKKTKLVAKLNEEKGKLEKRKVELDDEIKTITDVEPACGEYANLYDSYNNNYIAVKMSGAEADHGQMSGRSEKLVSLQIFKPKAIDVPPASRADCKIGVCYRPARNYVFRMGVTGGTSGSINLVLPNASPLVAIDISRAFLVQKVTTLDFDDDSGLLKKFEIDKKSELLAAAQLPNDIIKAALELPAEFIQLRIDYVTAEDNLNKGEVALAEKQGELAAAKKAALLQNAKGKDELPQPLLSVNSFRRVY